MRVSNRLEPDQGSFNCLQMLIADNTHVNPLEPVIFYIVILSPITVIIS